MGNSNQIFQGIFNFRDISNTITELKKNVLFRSSYLYQATSRDIESIKSLGLTKIIDLRSEVERRKYPDPVIPGIKLIENPIFENDAGVFKGQEEVVRYYSSSPQAGFWRMMATYKKMVSSSECQIAMQKALVEIISHNYQSGGVLLHCSAGKDRTGFLVSLILYILQVEPTEILTEYLLSNSLSKKHITKKLLDASQLIHNPNYWNSVYDLSTVKKAYLDRSVEVMNYEFQGVGSYLCRTLNISSEMTRILRRKVLVDD